MVSGMLERQSVRQGIIPAQAEAILAAARQLTDADLRKIATLEREVRQDHGPEYMAGRRQLEDMVPMRVATDILRAADAIVLRRGLSFGDETMTYGAIASAAQAALFGHRLSRPALAAVTYAWRHRNDPAESTAGK